MYILLEKYFNRNLDVQERTQDYPKPNCPALEVPKLNDDVKQQLKQKDKDPYFGAEWTMFYMNSGPLTCMWAHLLRRSWI